MSIVDYGEYKIGTMSKQSKDERNPEISTISEWIPTYGSWAGPEWAGGVSVPRGDDIDWYEPPCMNKAIKNANANPLECYSLVDAITKTHDWDYEVAEHSGGLEGLKKTQADAKMLTDLAIKTNDLETNGYTTYVCGTGIDPETGAPYDPFFYTATLIDETETSYIGLLVPLFTIKLVADPLAAAKDLIVGACMSVWNYVKGALGTNEVTYSDTVKTTTVEEENGGLIWEKYNGDSRTADAWILNPDNIKSYTTAEVTFGEGGTKPENTYEYLGNGVCRVNGSDIGDRIFASDDTENQAQLVLEGGGGKDKYYIPYNSGDDKIIDSGENEIYYTDENGEYHKAGNYYKDSSDVSWSSLDDETQFNDSSKTILLEDGGTIELSSDFEEGDFDIRLIEIPDNPNTNNTVTSDQDLDNVNDELYGTEANDRIEGLTGDDDISASLGGDDWLLGGVGSDVIVSQNATGKDILEGNAGRDILWGGLGDDKVFGENYGQMETVIADGETAQSINELGDLASGCAGDDFTYGSNRIDLLFGSDGNDLLVGGGGGDVIWGDNQFTYAVRNWGLTIDADGWASTITMVGIDYIEEEVYGDDVIYAGTGNDFVYAGSGNDEIYTGDDNDYAYGEAGDDFIEGGDGNDVLVGDEYTVPIANQGNDYIDGGSGDDMMRGDAGSDDLFGGDGNDTIYGDGEVEDERTGDDYIDGEAGDDGLYGYGGNDVIFGGDGNDNIEGDYLTAGDDYIDGEAGNDTIIGAGGSDQIYGGNGDDTLHGDAGNVAISDQGEDYIEGGAGNDLIVGYAGNDELYGDDGTDTIYGNEGDDYIDGGLGNDTIYAGDGNDTIYDGDGTNQIYGEAGNDYILGGEGDNLLDGGDGNDTIYGGAGSNMIGGGDGDNELYGSDSDDQIYGGSGNNYIEGGGGNDTLDAGSGSGTLDGGEGDDNLKGGNTGTSITLIGGVGNDDYTIYTASPVVIENADEGTDTVHSMATYTLGENVENLRLWGDDAINGAGNELDNILMGSWNANHLSGDDGSDMLFGNDGDDTLDGGAGNDSLYGGYFHRSWAEDWSELPNTANGNDTYLFGIASGQDIVYDRDASSGNVDTILLGSGIQSSDVFLSRKPGEMMYESDSLVLSTNGAPDTLTVQNWFDETGEWKVERIQFADGTIWDEITIKQKLLQGTPGDDYIVGYSTSDKISGQGGNDEIYAGDGNDTLAGGDGNDLLYGESGDDVLTGGSGNGTLYGGTGNDTYGVDSTGDVVTEYAGEGTDTVQSSISYTLGLNVENLTLTGSIAINGTGNELNNSITGNSGNNILTGGDGNDTLNGGTGADTMIGGVGDDRLYVDNTGDVVTENAGEGTDRVYSYIDYTLGANVENLTLTGSAAINGTGNDLNNSITGNSANNVLSGGDGNDTLNGGVGADTMTGGIGNDRFYVDNVGDVVTENAGEGTDTAYSYIDYTLGANVENLTLTGSAAVNGTGNELNNVLTGNSAANVLAGGAGNDTYNIDNTVDVITENADEGTDTVRSSITLALGANLENLTLNGSNAINGTGNELNNSITGNSMDNILSGGDGNDTLNGGAGTDTMIGGTGNDRMYVDNTGDVVTENAGEGTDTVYSYIDYTLGANVENLTLSGSAAINGIGNELNNSISGNSTNNILIGGDGDDTLNGSTGADTLIGGLGNDRFYVDNTGDVVTEDVGEGTDRVYSYIDYTLGANVENLTLTGSAVINGTGNALNNSITGNSVNNILDGGGSNDTMSGGSGNDTYMFRRTDGKDTITETAGITGDTDTLKVTDGITETEPVIVKQNNDLYLFIDENNYMKVTNEFYQTNYGIERLEVTDGYYITRSDIENIVNTMSAINNDAGMDVIQKFNAMRVDQAYINTLAQSWHQP